jgi:hypothetical protein
VCTCSAHHFKQVKNNLWRGRIRLTLVYRVFLAITQFEANQDEAYWRHVDDTISCTYTTHQCSIELHDTRPQIDW